MFKASKYFSIILDSTPDVSQKDQLRVVVMFVLLYNNSKRMEIGQNFFWETHIFLEGCRGQCYKNGANIKADNNGLQNKIIP